MRRGVKGALILAFICLLPAASASEHVHGILATQGDLSFAGSTHAALDTVTAFLVPDITQGLSLSVHAAYGRACHLSKDFVRNGPVPIVGQGAGHTEIPNPAQGAPTCQEGTNFNLAASGTGQPREYVGAYPDNMRAELRTEGIVALPGPSVRLASQAFRNASTASDPRNQTEYVVTTDQPSLLLTSSGNLTGTFSGLLKIRGLGIDFSTTRGSYHEDTGDTEPSGSIGKETVAWEYVEVQNATITLEGESPLQLIVPNMRADLTGTLLFTSATTAPGQLIGSDETYQSRTDERSSITGSWQAKLAPTPVTDHASLDLAGELATSSLARVTISHSAPAGVSLLPLLLSAATVTAGATGGIALYRRVLRTRRGASSSMGRFLDAHDEHRLWRAALWARLTRQAEPENPALHQHEGYALMRLGFRRVALRCYERAMRISGDGAPALEAAKLLDAREADSQLVEAWARRALEASPALVREIEDHEFPRLRGKPSWEQELARAKLRSRNNSLAR